MATVLALRPVACVAALNATAQGLIGLVLGILGLCVCFCGLGSAPQASGNDFGQYLTYYLQGDECGNGAHQLYTGVTSPTALRVWLALSLFFSASMLASSLALFLAVVRRWSDEKLQITLVSWLFINTFTAVDDVILGYVFGNDYLTVRDVTPRRDSLGPTTLLLVTFLVARGVYLWLLNLCFILYLFTAARKLHKLLNQQVPGRDQQPIESWPTLDDFGKAKGAEFERTPTAINPRLAERLDDPARYPEHSALARWPALNGEAQVVRESRRESHRGRRSRSLREPSFRRAEGADNPAYDTSDIYYLRLSNDRDYDPGDFPRRDSRRNSRERARSRREVVGDSAPGMYKPSPPPPGPSPPPPTPGYIDENGIIIPPIDYLDPPEDTRGRPLTLQEAILDKTLRLKKVPEELKRGIQK